MKTLTTMVISLLMIASFTPESQAQKRGDKTVVIEANMTCGQCKAKIEKDIAFERGVRAVEANHETKLVTIHYRENRNSDENLVKAIEKLGYKAKVHKPQKSVAKCMDRPSTDSKSCCSK